VGLADRLAALDGSMEIDSAVGVGTTVTGRVPFEPIDAS
jgi:signal transduction histidine kinase